MAVRRPGRRGASGRAGAVRTAADLTFVGDPGIDDAIALGVLVGRGAAPARVVATAGNVDAARTARVAAGLSRLLGLGGVVESSDRPVVADAPGGARQPAHGEDGFGGRAGELPPGVPVMPYDPATPLVEVLALGPLSALAQAIDAGNVPGHLVWMGGSVAVGGNVTATAEFNAWCDPEAVDAVLRSAVPVLEVVPLDVTTRVRLTDDDLARWRAGAPSARALAEATAVRVAAGDDVPHDAVAAIALLEPERFYWEARHVRCETGGLLTRGATVVDRRPWGRAGDVRVATGIDAAGVHDAIVDAVAALP